MGTSGFSYADWKQVFYPAHLRSDEWLAYFAEHFKFCELNFSYYRMPEVGQMEKYLAYPIDYAIKAHRSLTHDRVPFPAAREDFKRGVSPLAEGGRLASVLLQFPYSFAYTPANRVYLLELLEYLTPLPLVVEFRHPAWIKDSVFKALRQHAWGISMIDSPNVNGGMPAYDAVTSEIGYLRFHGRNEANWWTGNNVTRYDYGYSSEELEAWLPRIEAMSKQARTTYIAFNNHAGGQAIQNAKQLTEMLKRC